MDRGRYIPDPGETAFLFLSLFNVSIMSLLFGRKSALIRFRSINYARGLVLVLLLFSWAFSFSAALLVQTNNFNIVSCQLSSLTCIFLYAASKIAIYLFFIERVNIVTGLGVNRWRSPMFKFNMMLLLPYFGIAVLVVKYRDVEIEADGRCTLALLEQSSVPLVVYDTLISFWLTALFVKALISSTSVLNGPTRSKLRDVARRALIGSILSLISSNANISMFLVFEHERGLFCLALCTVDVTLNAITIHWATSRGDSSSNVDKKSFVEIENAYQPPLQRSAINYPTSPIKSHVSVSIQSYVEQYHQIHLADSEAPVHT
ncbi:hypothetical protein BGZ98_007786 [Dissophora globulifera]|nr:hypothetical protein BGZ98_007786 [Dissophora globulifera]